MYHDIAALIRCVYVRGAGSSWAIYHNFDGK
jgi:hypothetical protein